MAEAITEGAQVQVAPHPSWNAEYRKLADSGRVGVAERVFRPMGAWQDTVRVVFPKKGRAKERVEFFAPSDLVIAEIQRLRKEGE